jgi:putative NADH-flavin reductase
MKIALFGATGGTGKQILSQALEQGHEITVFVRDPQKISAQGQKVRIVTGSVTDNPEQVAEAVRGQDAVISSLGRGNSLKPEGLIASAMSVLVPAMERAGVRRFVCVSAFGVGDTGAQRIPFVPKLIHSTLLRSTYADKAAGEEILRGSRLDWTLVRPTILSDDPKSGSYRSGLTVELKGVPKVSRADVADLVLAVVRDGSYVRESVHVTA